MAAATALCSGAAQQQACARAQRTIVGTEDSTYTAVWRRINHLKAVSVAQERQIQTLTASLAAQHELLQDAQTRVAQIVHTIPPPQSLAGGSLAAPARLRR